MLKEAEGINNSGYDWFRFWLHFIFGAVTGAVIGGIFWMQNCYFGMNGWMLISSFSIAVALLGGIYGDRFWEWFIRNLRWLH